MSTNLLELTGDDIAQLDDVELRTLIGQLCESDYRCAGLPTTGIVWGGYQNATDGGIDVYINGGVEPPPNSFIPKSNTGIQVKTPDMSRSKILKEMKPYGVLRNEIKKLIKSRGAYIIVCSKGSTTSTALTNRIGAMREAVEHEENHQHLSLKFLDRGRIATWVRSHPSLILWVRNKISRPLNGWRPYENWSNALGGITEEYLIDDNLIVQDGTKIGTGISVEDGLARLRSTLSVPGSSIRLIGLSGVGKTRFVQALFDDRVGDHPLNQTYAYYTDIGENPTPDPIRFAELLIAGKARAILIVDNCAPDLHRILTGTCSVAHSTLVC